MKLCCHCDRPAGPTSKVFCEYHRGYHTGHSVALMAAKRAADPDMRERERKAVKRRMRKLRAKRRSAQLTLPR